MMIGYHFMVYCNVMGSPQPLSDIMTSPRDTQGTHLVK